MLININDEDIHNLKIAEKKLIEISEPYVDLDVFTIQSIIERYNEAGNSDTERPRNEKGKNDKPRRTCIRGYFDPAYQGLSFFSNV